VGCRTTWCGSWRLVVVTSPHAAASHFTFLPGAVSSVHFTNGLCGMVGDGSRLGINFQYTVQEVRLDATSFVKGLSGASKSALREFVANPDSSMARARFQETLPEEVPSPDGHEVERCKDRPQVATTIERCAIVVVGDDNEAILEPKYRAPRGDLDLGRVLKHNDPAATAPARHLAQPDDEAAQREFDRCVARAIDPDILRLVLDNADFDCSRTTVSRFFGSARANGAIAGSVGVGTKTRSTITVRAHEIALDGMTAFDNVAPVEVVPETDQYNCLFSYVDPAEEEVDRFQREQEQRAIEDAAARRRIQTVLEEVERRRRRQEEIGLEEL